MAEKKKNSTRIAAPLVDETTEAILKLVEMVNTSEISSIKTSVAAIVRVINDPRSSVNDLKEVIQLDPPLTARVLKTANSAYYTRSFDKRITDIEQAIIWMGLDVIKELALNQKVCEVFDKDERIGNYSRKALWRHSIAVAKLAKMIFRKEFGQRGENIYVAGLLHDIGIIAEDQFLMEDFAEALRLSKNENIDLAKAELTLLGYHHGEVGEAISSSWGLPEELSLTIGTHTHPLTSKRKYAQISSTLYVADYLCQIGGFSYGASPIDDQRSYNKCLKIMGVKSMAIDMIFNGLREELKRMEDKGVL